MKHIKRSVHLDFHTLPGIPDLGSRFDATAFADTLRHAGVQMINAFARCNIGFAYYPTRHGIVHPHLKFDMLGQMVEACSKVGIDVVAYFNIGLDHEMARRHREWCVVNKDGQVISGDRTRNFFRIMCLNTGYREYTLHMIREVMENYPVRGVFLDCLVANPCYGNECAQRLVAQGKDPLDDDHVAAHSKQMVLDFCKEVRQLIGPDKLLLPNGLAYVDRTEFASHVEIECLPGAWGYDYFAAHAAFTRKFKLPSIYMTGRFHSSWGDFGGLKRKASLEYDCWDALSNAMAISVGDHMHPRDGLEPATYEMIGEVFQEVHKYEPYVDGASVAADIAILMPEEADFASFSPRSLDAQNAVYAAARMLGELHYAYDILCAEDDLSGYGVLILPDDIPVTPQLAAKLEAHLTAGGGIISSGLSGLDPSRSRFAMPQWQMKSAGLDTLTQGYFNTSLGRERGIRDRLYAIYKPAILLGPAGQGISLASYHQPYFDRHWDGFHGHFYIPPQKPTGTSALVQSGRIFQFAFHLFTEYSQYAMPEHRYLLGCCLDQILPAPCFKSEGIPPTARVMLTRSPSHQALHVKVTYPELRGRFNVIEHHNELTGGVIYLKAARPKKVYLAPDQTPLPYRQEGEYVRIELPRVVGYAMVIVE